MGGEGSGPLILGLAAGYHFGDLRPFAASLAGSGFAGRCLLFTSATTREPERLASYGIEVRPYAPPPDLAHLPAGALRYFLYLDFLRREARECGPILLTDVRDVVFQSDPFAAAWPQGLNVALEHGGRTVGACPYTSRWVRLHLGEAALEALAGRPVSCSGTTVGSHAAILDYLEKLTARLVPFIPAAHMAGYDQGVHNLLVHTGLVPEPAFHDNAGPILTLGWRKETPAVDRSGNVLNDAGLPAVLVHQYDRHPALHKMVRERWG